MHRRIAVIALTFGLVLTACAEVSVPSFFSDHMVLQREMPIAVWGWAGPGEAVSVKLGGGAPVTTKAGQDGAWKVKLPEAKAGGPFVLIVKGTNEIRINDVLVGEVWLCSGQSNMEWTVSRSNNFDQEKAAAKDGLIRHIKIPKRPMAKPDPKVQGSWAVCSPETVGNFTACGYFMARHLRKELKVPIGLINSSWGGTRIEPWTPPVGFASVPALKSISEMLEKDPPTPQGRGGHQRPTMLYNGMIHALVGYSMRGAIWYQGESNHVEGMLYTEKKKALINGWRKLWGIGDFPFNFVQIAPFHYGKESPGVLARFWVAQSASLKIPNTGMVVTYDIGNYKDIHPRNKQDVGLRLALIALNKTYGRKDVEYSGPVFKEMKVEGNKIRVSFEHAAGLKSRDGKPLTWFQVLGEEAGWVDAQASIAAETVLVSSPKVAQPISVRFAWHKQAEANLSNGAGLPAATFTAGGGVPYADSLPKIDEARNYELVYALNLERLGAAPAYEVDNSAKVKAFDRIAYLLELQSEGRPVRYAWASMDAFTADAKKIGIPTVASGASFQQKVTNLTVVTNAENVTAGTFAEGGNIEFWPNNYGPANGGQVPGADEKVYDIGDQPSEPKDGYGSMQVHNGGAKQTIFAINQWKSGGGADIGIGNSTGETRDWTFTKNAGNYPVKKLRVFVRVKK